MAAGGLYAATAMATWCFLIGGYVAYYLGAAPAIPIMIAGGLFGIFIIYLAVVPASTRYGVESIVSTRPALGVRGSTLSLGLAALILIAWNAILLIFLGRAVATILIAMDLVGPEATRWFVSGGGLLAVVAAWLVMSRGSQVIRAAGIWVAAIVTILAVWLAVEVVTGVGLSAVLDAAPLAPTGDDPTDLTLGLEIMIASTLSWWPYVGAITQRLSKKASPITPVILGLSLPLSVVSVVGLLAALSFPDSGGDPTLYVMELGGNMLGIVALSFVILANIGTVAVGVFSLATGIRQGAPLGFQIGWNSSLVMTLLPVAVIVVLIPDWFFDNLGAVLAFAGVLIAPLCGVLIADYYFLRRQYWNVAALYDFSKASPYYFLGGFNPIGIVSIVLGFGVYVVLLHPVSYETASLFAFLTASVPAAIVSGVVHGVSSKLLSQRLPWGGISDSSPPGLPDSGQAAGEVTRP
jgi:nucleobase:cation symporter-1, NCS1 family